jgi:lactoylglutathione lyase
MADGIIKGLDHIGVVVKDVDKSVDFYRRLGFTLDNEDELGFRLAFLSCGNCPLELIEQKDGEPRPAGTVDHIAFEVDDVRAAVKSAKENGIEIDEAMIGEAKILGGIKNVFFAGPDGERLEFFEYTGR